MSEELKVQIPDGYRWVELGEERNGAEWRNQQSGNWVVNDRPTTCLCRFCFITPIKSKEPETVDVPVYNYSGALVFDDPNGTGSLRKGCAINDAPCIVGPEWAFAGFVWDGHQHQTPTKHYYKMMPSGVEYAKEVRFRKVKGVK